MTNSPSKSEMSAFLMFILAILMLYGSVSLWRFAEATPTMEELQTQGMLINADEQGGEKSNLEIASWLLFFYALLHATIGFYLLNQNSSRWVIRMAIIIPLFNVCVLHVIAGIINEYSIILYIIAVVIINLFIAILMISDNISS